MTEEEARSWLSERFSTATIEKLSILADAVEQENLVQNLISPSTTRKVWGRHIVDSAQLLGLAPSDWRHWLDVGSGAGFPGVVIGVLSQEQVTLVEPRRRRAAFLNEIVDRLGLANVRIWACKVERVAPVTTDVISARAVARVEALFKLTRAVSTLRTTYVLPRGETGVRELERAQHDWHGVFHVKQSVTDPASTIIVATGVREKR